MLIRKRGPGHRYIVSELDHSTSNPSQMSPSTGIISHSQSVSPNSVGSAITTSNGSNSLSPNYLTTISTNDNISNTNIQSEYNRK